MTGTAVEALFRRESIVVLAALVALMLLAWVALLAGAGTGMDPFAMSGWLHAGGAASGAWLGLDARPIGSSRFSCGRR